MGRGIAVDLYGSCLLQQRFLWVRRAPCPCRGACRQLPAALINISFWDVGKCRADRLEHITGFLVIVAPGCEEVCIVTSSAGKSNGNGIKLACERTLASADASSLPRLLEASPDLGTFPCWPCCKPQQLLLLALGDPLALFASGVTLPSAG